jgi:1-deoxy-D-xylulose-5-phosphate reductoisomerase
VKKTKNLVLLGATGSIGESTLRVIRKHSDKIKLIGISANQNVQKLLKIAKEFKVPHASLVQAPKENFSVPVGTELETGEKSLENLACMQNADIVVVAVVGSSGLLPTLAAVNSGKDVVLANKESLVVGGNLITIAAKKNQSRIIPADSEHNAIFQCLQGQPERSIESVILTASGGPFRNLPMDELLNVTVEQALKHPNWSMGKKITVDSATMANKGLELIEAKWLFDLSPNQLEVVIHPPSIIHGIVRFLDGCCLAQMTPPSMTFAMQNAILYPDRVESVEPSLDFSQPLDLSFSPPSLERYPCLKIAKDVLKQGGTAPLIFNASNEVAVDAFLRNRIGFLDISRIIEETLNDSDYNSSDSVSELLSLDLESRLLSENHIKRLS